MTKKYIQDFKSKLSNGGTLEPEELQDFFSRLEGDLKDKKYGLVWESQTEQVIEQLKTNKVYLEEEQDLKITQDPDNPNSNILIEGDNYEALTYLKQVNQKVDVIYIDPPYNTGNKDFIYNDRFIDKEDGFRHSQWLSFMDARLRLARELLTDEGVIFISIDDNEQSQLKLLCDEVFGEQNFVSTSIWHSNKSVLKQSKTIRKDHEYVLVYAFNYKLLKFNRLENNMKFTNIDNDPKGPWFSSNATLKTDKTHANYYGIELPNSEVCYRRWKFSESDFKAGNVDLYFKGGNVPRLKIYESDYPKKTGVPSSIISDKGSSTTGINEISNILAEGLFSYPKPKDLIKYLINLHINPNATVLDFFAGSGTTGQALLELNKEDGGSRQFILVTNNENNIARDVTYERNKRVIEGYTTPKGKDVPGVPSNLAYYKTKQVSKYDIDFDEFMLQHIIPVIQFTEGVYSRTQHSPHTTQLGENIFIFNQYMVEDDEIDTLVGLVKDEDILYIQEGQVDYIKTKLPDGVVYKYLEDVLPTNR